MTQVYEGEVLKVDSDGALSVVTLTITDDDVTFSSGEVGATWVVDGISLGANAPDLHYVPLDVTRSDGFVDIYNDSLRFDVGTDSYYIMHFRTDPNAITVIGPDNVTGTINGNFEYLHHGLAPQGVTVRHADVF